MNRLFGQRKSPAAPPDLGACVDGIDARIDSISKKVDNLNDSLKKLSEQMAKLDNSSSAKQLLKKRAVTMLRQKRQYEQQLDQLRAQSFNIEQQRISIQAVQDSKVTVDAMKMGVKQMKRQMKTVNLDDIDKIKDQMDDYMMEADEVQEALSRQYNVPEIDDAELESELAMIADEFVTDGTGIEKEDEKKITTAPIVPHREPPNSSSSSSARKQGAIQMDEFGLPILPSDI